jgi:hypothetical protein
LHEANRIGCEIIARTKNVLHCCFRIKRRGPAWCGSCNERRVRSHCTDAERCKLRRGATNDLYEWFQNYNRPPNHNAITIQRLGPNGAYGWIAKSDENHGGLEYRGATVHGVIGHSVKPLTTITSYYSNAGLSCGPPAPPCTTLSVKYAFGGTSVSRPLPLGLRQELAHILSPPTICPTKLSRTLSSRCRSRDRVTGDTQAKARSSAGPSSKCSKISRLAVELRYREQSSAAIWDNRSP